jgi:hypothetical protein
VGRFLDRAHRRVLYTFYPPLTASPWYFIGLVLVVVGSWIWCVLMTVALHKWKREDPGRPVPLAMFATVANAILWLWTTIGMAAELLLQVIPAALGYVQTIDAGLSTHAVFVDAAPSFTPIHGGTRAGLSRPRCFGPALRRYCFSASILVAARVAKGQLGNRARWSS